LAGNAVSAGAPFPPVPPTPALPVPRRRGAGLRKRCWRSGGAGGDAFDIKKPRPKRAGGWEDCTGGGGGAAGTAYGWRATAHPRITVRMAAEEAILWLLAR